MKLLIDAGNTRAKWAWCPQQSFTSTTQLQVSTLENRLWMQQEGRSSEVGALHAAVLQANEIWVSNVAGLAWQQFLEELQPAASIVNIKASTNALGLQNGYLEPSQLGSDRWCSLLAVWQLYRQNALIVTAGTAMTIDALQVETEQGATFIGGSIQPGLQLMWQGLQQGAAQLDYAYLTHDWPPEGFARHSQQAMWMGCVQAMTASVATQYVQLTNRSQQSPLLVLSGGDAELLQRYLPGTLSAPAIIVDNLVLKGLACLAESASS
ncbi:type III pantothenate kinase [Methylophilus rhizosphaerae]|uniref:Type III pantothenate kinase n=1 Tax=Methylophilus rhizosphaerae TaxID=492660 RepID=A0A1G9BGL8_9PROT|nr:type III pantothenate kinase [Methylophilus rhizosphaerae]SDK38668.1 type III pantothenate kinase [Methylophilus rhizosphaerae]